MIDLHTHILPYVDDGAEDINDSAMLVDMLLSQSVDKIALTPHYSPMHNSVEEFIEKRDNAFETIKFLQETKKVEFFLGAEVFFSPLLFDYENVEKLCISGTRYMLVEFPMDTMLEKQTLDGLEALTDRCGIVPIIAHAERYRAVQKNYKILYTLKEMGCVIQINSASITDKPFKPLVKKLVRKDLVDIISSDCHGAGKRLPKMGEAVCALADMLDMDYVKFLDYNAKTVLKNGTLN